MCVPSQWLKFTLHESYLLLYGFNMCLYDSINDEHKPAYTINIKPLYSMVMIYAVHLHAMRERNTSTQYTTDLNELI